MRSLPHSPVSPSLSARECGPNQCSNHLLTCSLLPCHTHLPWLPISTPPTCVDECFFFNSLVVGLPYSLIFWQFWGFFVLFCFFNLLLSFWLCEDVKRIYLHPHLGQKYNQFLCVEHVSYNLIMSSRSCMLFLVLVYFLGFSI